MSGLTQPLWHSSINLCAKYFRFGVCLRGVSWTLITSTDDKQRNAPSELIVCGNTDRSDSNDIACWQLSVAKLTAGTSPKYFLTLRPPLAHIEAAIYWQLFLRWPLWQAHARLTGRLTTFFTRFSDVFTVWLLFCAVTLSLTMFDVCGNCAWRYELFRQTKIKTGWIDTNRTRFVSNWRCWRGSQLLIYFHFVS